jgi:hypothetical protein
MISMQDAPTETAYTPAPAPGEAVVRVGLEGSLDDEALTALRAAGFELDGGAPAAWIAVGRSPAELARLVALGRPVIAVCPKQDFEQVSQLLRAGVAEVVLEPLRAPTLIRKLQRALHDRKESP